MTPLRVLAVADVSPLAVVGGGERALWEQMRRLARRGHDVTVTDAWSLGRVSAAGREPDGSLKAAANPRGMQGYAVGR